VKIAELRLSAVVRLMSARAAAVHLRRASLPGMSAAASDLSMV